MLWWEFEMCKLKKTSASKLPWVVHLCGYLYLIIPMLYDRHLKSVVLYGWKRILSSPHGTASEYNFFTEWFLSFEHVLPNTVGLIVPPIFFCSRFFFQSRSVCIGCYYIFFSFTVGATHALPLIVLIPQRFRFLFFLFPFIDLFMYLFPWSTHNLFHRSF